MTLEKLQHALQAVRAGVAQADAEIVSLLLARIASWKQNDATPEELGDTLDRALGHSWFSSDRLHFQVYELVSLFQSKIGAIGGMTMNERLVIFDLMERWDRSSENERDLLYAKLVAAR